MDQVERALVLDRIQDHLAVNIELLAQTFYQRLDLLRFYIRNDIGIQGRTGSSVQSRSK